MKPTHMQRDTLVWLAGSGPALVEDVPRKVAWYARDVLTRMVGRGWVECINPNSPKHMQKFQLTPLGREQITPAAPRGNSADMAERK